MVTEYGMSEAVGPIAFNHRSQQRFLEAPASLPPERVAEDTAQTIDAEVKRLVVDAHTRACDILTGRLDALRILARRLIEEEVVGADVRALVEKAPSATQAA